jgi:hypothetical protein
MSRIKITLIAFSFVLIISLASALAATPHLISLQGYVTDNLGSPISSGNVTVRIYDASTGGNLIYNSGTDYNNAIQKGIFDVLLGSITPLNLDNTVKYYMEIDINGQEVIGDATTGRREFWPGGGQHTHTHVATDITGGPLTIDSVINIAGDNNTYKEMRWIDTSSGKIWEWSHRVAAEGNNFEIFYNNGYGWVAPPALTITPNGSVGISTANPQGKFEVSGGNVLFDNNVDVGVNLSVSGALKRAGNTVYDTGNVWFYWGSGGCRVPPGYHSCYVYCVGEHTVIGGGCRWNPGVIGTGAAENTSTLILGSHSYPNTVNAVGWNCSVYNGLSVDSWLELEVFCVRHP